MPTFGKAPLPPLARFNGVCSACLGGEIVKGRDRVARDPRKPHGKPIWIHAACADALRNGLRRHSHSDGSDVVWLPPGYQCGCEIEGAPLDGAEARALGAQSAIIERVVATFGRFPRDDDGNVIAGPNGIEIDVDDVGAELLTVAFGAVREPLTMAFVDGGALQTTHVYFREPDRLAVDVHRVPLDEARRMFARERFRIAILPQLVRNADGLLEPPRGGLVVDLPEDEIALAFGDDPEIDFRALYDWSKSNHVIPGMEQLVFPFEAPSSDDHRPSDPGTTCIDEIFG